MMRITPLSPSSRAAWDRLVIRSGAGFMQSWAWSRFKEAEGYVATRLGVVDDDRLVGGAIVYTFPSPAEGRLAVVPDGPVLDWQSPRVTDMLTALVDAYRRTDDAKRVVAVRLEPRLEAMPAALASLARAPLDLVPDETLEVPLDDEPAMLARMKPKGRYNVKVAARHRVETETSLDPSAVDELYHVLRHTADLQDFSLEPKSFFIDLATTLVPESARFAFARWKGMTLAAALTVRHGSTVTFLYGGHVPLFRHVMASTALHWHVMREAARDGLRVYDLYGWVPPGSPEHPYDRFSRFKEKFGGRPVRRIGSRDVIFYDRLAEIALGAAVEAP
jgi:lipid II:glycine glycyltransferase (peptidoglycan interpeptide bridge formation enzyme)